MNMREEERSKGNKRKVEMSSDTRHVVVVTWKNLLPSLWDGNQSLKASASKADNTRILFLDMTLYIDFSIY